MAAVAISDLPAGTVLGVVQNGDGSWPNRPTSRADLKILWIRIMVGSDPASVTSPAVNGGYQYDPVVGPL